MDSPGTAAPDDAGDEEVVVPLHGPRRGRSAPQAADWRAFDPEAPMDTLTSLHGHPWFEEDLRGAAQRRRGAENPWVAIARVGDVDEIVERMGAEVAAEAVRAVAVRMRDSLRSGDRISRISSDSFGLIVDAPSADEALGALARVAQAVREMAAANRRWPDLRVRIGVAPLLGDDPAPAVREAEAATGDADRRGVAVALGTGARANDS